MLNLFDVNRHTVRVQHSDAVIASGLMAALTSQADLEVVEDATIAVDLVVCDYDAGLELAQFYRQSRSLEKASRVLVVTGLGREQSVRHALQSAVHGYLLASASVDDLLAAVRMVLGGKSFVSSELAQRMADSMTREALTARETEVLAHLATGRGNKEVALYLGIATGTVKTHVNAIMAKLEVTSRTHAVSVAAQRGLVDLTQRTLH